MPFGGTPMQLPVPSAKCLLPLPAGWNPMQVFEDVKGPDIFLLIFLMLLLALG